MNGKLLESIRETMKIYKPRTRGDKFSMYKNQLVVVVPKEKAMGKVYLTSRVDDLLGQPEYVAVGVRGSNMYLFPSAKEDGFRVSQSVSHKNSMRWITVVIAIKENEIRPGVYRAQFDDGVISFDFYQKPSAL